MAKFSLRLIDIGANMTDPMFQGMYRGKQSHDSDYNCVLDRAAGAGVERIIITGGSLQESREALNLAQQRDCLYSTVGVHPTRCNEFVDSGDAEQHLQSLLTLVENASDKVAAIGECGLDYDRLEFCDKQTQLKYFEMQFQLAEATKLPMFLHNRNTGGDFARLVRENRHRFTGGVAHSFTGDAEELAMLLALDLYIGINGCSLKTEENLEVMGKVPLDRLLIETDAPWCDLRNTHASAKYLQTKVDGKKKEKFVMGQQVKSRNEPCNLIQVLEVVAGYRPDVSSLDELASIVHANTMRLFWPHQEEGKQEAVSAQELQENAASEE